MLKLAYHNQQTVNHSLSGWQGSGLSRLNIGCTSGLQTRRNQQQMTLGEQIMPKT
jgi:hypothetical protein